MNTKTEKTLPIFDLQTHHSRVQVPTEFDMRDLARKFSVFPLKTISQNGRKRLLLAMRNPYDAQAIMDCEFRSGMDVIAVQADDKDIQWLIQTHYFGRKLSPSPSHSEHEISHDVFAQLEMTSGAQKQPDWMGPSIQPFTNEEKKD
jgi:hypothetical protein